MFIDKGKLLFQLNQQYQKGGIQIVSLYAHPGMGKTRLLQEFSKEKQVLYFKASPVLYEENFRLFKNLCVRRLDEQFQTTKKFSEIFRLLAKSSLSEPLVLILDDVSYLISQNKRFPTMLHALEKKAASGANLFILLCKPGHLYEKEQKKRSPHHASSEIFIF